MKSRVPVIALVVAALGGIVAFIASNTRWEEITLPGPLRGEAVTNPFYAAQKFAEALGAQTEWRHSLGSLTQDVDVLILSNWHWDLIDERRAQIKAWVEAGGRLLIDNTINGGEDFWEWSGIGWEYHSLDEEEDEVEARTPEPEGEDAAESRPAPEALADDAVNKCGTFEQVDDAGVVVPDGQKLSVCRIDIWGYLTVDRSLAWGFAHEDDLQAARVEVGNGSVTVLNADPFGNRDLLKEDHGKLFVAATNLKAGDRIVFISEREHSSLLSLMWQHGAPVVMLALATLAALLWRGGVRFGPLAAAPDSARRSLAEQIRGTGRFAIRLGDGQALHVATLRAMHEAARKRIPRYDSLPHEERIAAIAGETGLDAEALATAIDHLGPRRTTELAHTIALLESARRRILE